MVWCSAHLYLAGADDLLFTFLVGDKDHQPASICRRPWKERAGVRGRQYRDAGSLCDTAGTCRARHLSDTRYGNAANERVALSVDAIALLLYLIFVDLDDAFAHRRETDERGLADLET